MNQQRPSIKIPTKVIKPEPRICWAGPHGGEPNFPSSEDFWNQHNQKITGPNHWLEDFHQALYSAIQDIWIIDKYFLGKVSTGEEENDSYSGESALDYICETLRSSNVLSLRIITGARPDEARNARNALLAARLEPAHGKIKPTEVNVAYAPRQVGYHGMRFVHDRFAIIDNMLWHFGATVGGVHWALNAASGPWDANKTNARDFFKKFWDKCKFF